MRIKKADVYCNLKLMMKITLNLILLSLPLMEKIIKAIAAIF